MTRSRRPSAQTLNVLTVLEEARDGWLYGLQISEATGLKSGSLYPILIRLSERGLVDSRWLEPERPGRPARHAYRLTAQGRRVLAAEQVLTTALSPQGA